MLTKDKRWCAAVVDLGYGDSGKGTLVDWLCAERGATLTVRFNGGSQAAHNVVTRDGRHHTFSQFGAGMFNPGVRAHLSRHCLISPLAMNVEARTLAQAGVRDAYARATIHREALVITPFHRAANRLRELARNAGRHGSCGVGIGETASHALSFPDEALRVGELEDDGVVLRKLGKIRERKRAELDDAIRSLQGVDDAATSLRLMDNLTYGEAFLDHMKVFLRQAILLDEAGETALFAAHDRIAFEGAQGVLLDEKYGFHPHTTWSRCTFENANELLGAYGGDRAVTRVGVIRGYMTRHGAGPLVTEDAALAPALDGEHNAYGRWQGSFRQGWLDLPAIRYAIKASGGPDVLAVTCLDKISRLPRVKVCSRYAVPPEFSDVFVRDADGMATEIRFTPGKSNERQERITNALKSAEPWCYELNGASAPFSTVLLSVLQRELPVPVAIRSYGPTSADKRLNPLSEL